MRDRAVIRTARTANEGLNNFRLSERRETKVMAICSKRTQNKQEFIDNAGHGKVQ
jgi:hypothetical protein